MTNGTVVIAANGSMTFKPNENFNGDISFDYVARTQTAIPTRPRSASGGGPERSGRCRERPVRVNEDGSVSLNLLANDKAPDGGLAIVSSMVWC